MFTAVEFFKLVADDTRLRCLLLLVQEGELCVCELMTALNESQPKISRHLALLRDAKLLLDRRQGQWVFYRLNEAAPAWALATLQQVCAAHLDAIALMRQQLCQMGDRPQRCC